MNRALVSPSEAAAAGSLAGRPGTERESWGRHGGVQAWRLRGPVARTHRTFRTY
jgi:hypothetical protein